ncbi:MAG: hypothetical protein ACREX3_03680, partial [Gammaproteobacteria bacterium]
EAQGSQLYRVFASHDLHLLRLLFYAMSDFFTAKFIVQLLHDTLPLCAKLIFRLMHDSLLLCRDLIA